uniref:ADP,ATP carrier protein n=1 Tax=Chaetoceros debilis TaxID=122233 RepID=A0A7S3V8E7_9STRA
MMNPFLILTSTALLASKVELSQAFATAQSSTLPLSPNRHPSGILRLPTDLNAANYRSTVAQTPGAELFNSGSSYVPSGLTKEQYEEIKRKEQQDTSKKDFASWGPRFSKSEKPSGDWMVAPSLWTGGFEVKNSNQSNSASSAANLKQKLMKFLPVYALASLLMEIIFSATFFLHKKEVASVIATGMLKLKRGNDALMISTSLLNKVMASKLIVATILVKPLNALIESCNKNVKLVWSPRRTMFITAMGSMAVLSLWSTLILVVKALI